MTPHDMDTWDMISAALDALLAMVIAIFGGAVNYLHTHKRHSWQAFLAASVTAAFAGLMSCFLTDWLGLDIRLQYAISGAAGYSGGVLLDHIVSWLVLQFKDRLSEK